MRQRAVEFFHDRKEDAAEWCEGRTPWLRVILLVYLAYAGVRHMLLPEYRSWFGGITLAFHEMGHIIFAMLGNTMMILGGSIMQLLIPSAAAAYLLLRQGDYFGFAVGGAWLSYSLWEMALYIYDAPREQLALVGFGDDPQHDWGTLLTRWHVLNYSDGIALFVRALAVACWAASIGLGAWLCWRMWRDSIEA